MANTLLKSCHRSIFMKRLDPKVLFSLPLMKNFSTKTKSYEVIKRERAEMYEQRMMKRAEHLEKKVKTLIPENKWYTETEWDNIKTTALANRIVPTEEAFSGTLMKTFQSQDDLITAKSLLSYLNQKNKPNVATLTFFLRLCAKYDDKNNEDSIINAYQDLKKKDFAYNAEVLNTCICAVAKTDLWQQGIYLIETLRKNREKLSDSAYNAFIMAAYRNNKFDVGFDNLNFNRILQNDVIIEWLNVSDEDSTMTTVFKLVEYLAALRIAVPLNLSDRIETSLQKKNYVGKYVNITPEGLCSHCNTYLDKTEFTDDDFASLRDGVLDSIIMGKDVYLNSSPLELKEFKNFINKTGPHDIVVDGLNAAYCNVPNKSKYNLAQQLIRVLTYLSKDSKKNILVLGKTHMNKWPASGLATIKRLSHLFLTETLSQDDTFMLYATLASGPRTMFVSNDFMRDHVYCLKNERLNRLFRDWQWSHQIYYVENQRNELEFLPPTLFKLSAQKTETTVHVPCTADDDVLTRITNLLPEKWLCCKQSCVN